MRGLLDIVKKRMGKKLFTPESLEDADVTNRLWELALFYGDEMDKCLAGAAHFAANAMGAAILETVLLIACLRHKSKVVATTTWQRIHKKEPPKPFSEMLSGNRIGLAALLHIARELKWLPKEGIAPEFRAELVAQVGEEKVRIVADGIPGILGGSEIAAILSTAVRNTLHPGRSIREPLAEHRFMSVLCTMLSLIAIGSIVETVP